MTATDAGYTIERVTWADPRAIAMHEVLNAGNAERYADVLSLTDPVMQAKLAEALVVDPAEILAALIAVDADGEAIGHAALRNIGDAVGEIKRVVVKPEQRGRGIALRLMTELEDIARAHGITRLILQTGDRQPEAVALYTRLGYTPIPVYPPYDVLMPTSFCFEKLLG